MDHALQALVAVIACFLFIVTVFITFWVFQCRKPKKAQQALKPKSTTELSSITVDDSVSFDPTSLRVATKDFSADFIIGDGRFGLVHKAWLSNGVTVAVKRLDPDVFKGSQEFCTEMVTLGMLRHPKIVKILGYCMTGSDRLLTYEFIQNQEQNVATPTLSWRTRIQIVWGVANGLFFLHGLGIVHRDIKSSNVLLDSDFQSHISDFGLARRIDSPLLMHPTNLRAQ
ncbi:putative serine/threonine-protein kinase pbl1 [Quercus suber]|uniref:Serine/threonine-protein kinase pbl1 n=1 Tax=Quercus suber TaxID=58331 RepID=A0AAW0KS47_QUESU